MLRTYLSALVLLITLLSPSLAYTQNNVVLYVSQDGNDAWSGSLPEPNEDKSDGPLRSFAHAKELSQAVVQDKRYAGLRVYVRGGDYFLDEPIHFGANDGGTQEHPLVWGAFNGETVRLIGGKSIGDWTQHKDNIFVAPLPEGGDWKMPGAQLFENSIRQTPARWPNKNAEGMPGGDWAFIQAERPEENKRAYTYADERIKNWADTSQLEVSIWPNYNWWQTIAGVESIDLQNSAVRLAEDLPYEIKAGRRFFFQNVFEELDAPGEWYLNPAEKKVYFYPAGDEPGNVILPTLENIVVMENTKHLKFIGFTLEICVGNAVVFKDTEECMVAKSVIRNTGGRGVDVVGGTFAQIVGNDIYSTGKGGVYLEGGDRKTLTPAGHQALNNLISRFGDIYQTYHTGVQVAGVGLRVAHNEIHDGPHIGILLNGNDHIIEFNDVYDVCQQGSDNGAFYMGRDWTQRGNILRYNKFHDVYGFGLGNLEGAKDGAFEYESPHQAWGVYLDDCSSGTLINGNIFYRIPLCGVMIGGGRDNTVTNNIFYDAMPALHIDDRWDDYPWETMFERLEAVTYKQPPYSERYPELLTMGDDPRRPANNRFESNLIYYNPDDFTGLSTTAENKESAVVYHFDQFAPETTTINRNIVWHNNKPIRIMWSEYKKDGVSVLEWEQWREKGFDADSYVQPPEFANIGQDNFSIIPDAPDFSLPFENLPWLEYGMFKDDLRASWPPPEKSARTLPERKAWPVNVPTVNAE